MKLSPTLYRTALGLSLSLSLSRGAQVADAAPPASQRATTQAAQGLLSGVVPLIPGRVMSFPYNVRSIDAYWVQPEGRGPWPALVFVHDIHGLTPWMCAQADQLAQRGYLVMVPNLYSRQGKQGPCRDNQEAFRFYRGLSDQDAVEDLRAAVTFLSNHPAVATDRMGIVGYDMGGTYGLLLACSDVRIKAVVNFYGRILYTRTEASRPVSPVEWLVNLRAPVLNFYGESDPQNPPEQLELLETKLKFNPFKTYYQLVRYPGVGHGFLVPSRQGYHALSAGDAQLRMEAFLGRILLQVAPAGMSAEGVRANVPAMAIQE